MLIKRFWDFSRQEDGQVTVDWVVLLAGLVTLAIGVNVMMGSAAQEVATDVGDDLSTREVGVF